MARNATLLRLLSVQVLIVCLVSEAVALPATHYYYQGAQVSEQDSSQARDSGFLVGNDRIEAFQSDVSIAGGNGQRLLGYLGDGKNNDILIQAHMQTGGVSNQSALESVDYRPYGQPLKVEGNQQLKAFGYNDEYQDPETQLTYLRARDYDPVHQHFITMDSYPLFNRCHFTNQDPINQIDPSGHQSFGKWWSSRPGWQKGLMIGGAIIIGGGLVGFGAYKWRSSRASKGPGLIFDPPTPVVQKDALVVPKEFDHFDFEGTQVPKLTRQQLNDFAENLQGYERAQALVDLTDSGKPKGWYEKRNFSNNEEAEEYRVAIRANSNIERIRRMKTIYVTALGQVAAADPDYLYLISSSYGGAVSENFGKSEQFTRYITDLYQDNFPLSGADLALLIEIKV